MLKVLYAAGPSTKGMNRQASGSEPLDIFNELRRAWLLRCDVLGFSSHACFAGGFFKVPQTKAAANNYLEAAMRDTVRLRVRVARIRTAHRVAGPAQEEHRHRDLLFRAVSSLLLLLFKHLRLNHVYQFEFAADRFVAANGIVLLLKYFNQNLDAFLIMADHTVPSSELFHFLASWRRGPGCEDVDASAPVHPISHRNFPTVLSLLRLLQKVCKGKGLRQSAVVLYKGPAILKRLLAVPSAPLHFYALKLFKEQVRFLGRNWRKSNMRILSECGSCCCIVGGGSYSSRGRALLPASRLTLPPRIDMVIRHHHHDRWYYDVRPDPAVFFAGFFVGFL